MIYSGIIEKYKQGNKQLALLIDPEKTSNQKTPDLAKNIRMAQPDFILVGGSLLSENTSTTVQSLKKHTDLPVILFPGSAFQVCSDADGILFLSLLSGRNPEFLISHHVAAAPILQKSGIETISTAYILIDGGKTSSVEYMSNTKPIPTDKTDLAVATSLAGEMLGMKLLYLEAGSGATKPVPANLISAVKKQIQIPLIVGGGINTSEKLQQAYTAGADIAVVGNALESNISLLKDFCGIRDSF